MNRSLFLVTGFALSSVCTASPWTAEAAGNSRTAADLSSRAYFSRGHTNPTFAGDLPFSQLPLSFKRRAAQRLEDMRTMSDGSAWINANFGGPVRTFYRPDITGPAYYELSVFDVTTNEPLGFIMLSATDRDFPVVHYRASGPSISQALIQIAQASQKTVAKFYKIDSLTYVGEDALGNLVAKIGRLPDPIIGDLGAPGTLEQTSYVPNSTAPDDQLSDPTATAYDSDPDGSSWTFGSFSGWSELKSNFTQSFSVLLDAHAADATDSWTLENAAASSGEGLRLGQIYNLAFISGNPQISKSGTGQALVQTQLIARNNVPGALKITVVSTGQQPQPFNVTLSYPSGLVETVKFMVVPESSLARSSAETSTRTYGWSAWSAWTTYEAGTSSNQRDYDQIDSGDGPNTSSCASGCGPTAWAMLIGWGDYQAHNGNAYWAPRTGLYRTDGGYGSTSAVAPSYQDTGIDNVTWELNGELNTWCTGIGENAATFPWDMDLVQDYLTGRTGTTPATAYNSAGIAESRLREIARDSIHYNDTPAVIGTGWLEHYPLAWKYRYATRTLNVLGWVITDYDREFYVNDGGSGTGGDGWIDASTWFAGELIP